MNYRAAGRTTPSTRARGSADGVALQKYLTKSTKSDHGISANDGPGAPRSTHR
jgi:hypothetical protein